MIPPQRLVSPRLEPFARNSGTLSGAPVSVQIPGALLSGKSGQPVACIVRRAAPLNMSIRDGNPSLDSKPWRDGNPSWNACSLRPRRNRAYNETETVGKRQASQGAQHD